MSLFPKKVEYPFKSLFYCGVFSYMLVINFTFFITVHLFSVSFRFLLLRLITIL